VLDFYHRIYPHAARWSLPGPGGTTGGGMERLLGIYRRAGRAAAGYPEGDDSDEVEEEDDEEEEEEEEEVDDYSDDLDEEEDDDDDDDDEEDDEEEEEEEDAEEDAESTGSDEGEEGSGDVDLIDADDVTRLQVRGRLLAPTLTLVRTSL